MSRQPSPAGEESWPRQWLHAAEDDITVPANALQVLRIYADVADLGDGRTACMSWVEMRRLTHQSNDLLQRAHTYGEDQGWLVRCPGPPGADSRRVYYLLEIGHSGKSREYKGKRPEREKNPRKRSVARNDINPWHGSEPIRATDQSDQSVARIETIRATDQSRPNQSVPRNLTLDLDRDREIDRSIWPRPGSPAEVLGQVEADLGAEVVAEVVRLVTSRGANDAARVIYAAVRDGRGPALIAEAREQIAARCAARAERPESADDRPSARQARDLCPRCDRTKHHPAPCADRESPPAPMHAVAETPCAAAERCQRPHLPVPAGETRHAVCALITGLRLTSAPDRASAPSQDGGEAA